MAKLDETQEYRLLKFFTKTRHGGAHDLTPAEAKTLLKKLNATDTSDPDDVDKTMKAANKALNGFGVEAIKGNSYRGGYYGNIVALYVNTGDVYESTILFEVEEKRFFVGTMGDWVAAHAEEFGIE